MIGTFVKYFQKLAAQHNQIKDFKYLDLEMLLGADTGGNLQFPVLMLDTLRGSRDGANSDVQAEKIEGGYVVLYQVAVGDYEAEKEALDNSLRLGRQIMDRMASDQYLVDCFFYDGFDFTSVKWEVFGPIGSNLHGVAFDFTLWLNVPSAPGEESVWQS